MLNPILKKWCPRLTKIVDNRDIDGLQAFANEAMKWRDDTGLGSSDDSVNFFIEVMTDSIVAIRHLEARGLSTR